MNRLKPIAASVSRASVAPVKPSAPENAPASGVADQPARGERQLGARGYAAAGARARHSTEEGRENPASGGRRGGTPSIRR